MTNDEDRGGGRVTPPEHWQQIESQAIPSRAAPLQGSDTERATSASRVTPANEDVPRLGGPSKQQASLTSDAKDQAAQLADEAKKQTAELAGQARKHVSSLIADQQKIAAERLHSFAGVLRDAAQNIEKHDVGTSIESYTNKAADRLEAISKYVGATNFQAMLGDAGQLARRRPEMFVGGTLLAGLIVARFLKASTRRNAELTTRAGVC